VDSPKIAGDLSMLKTRAVFLICVSLLGAVPILAQDSAETNSKIRKEGTENSQIMRTMHFLTDLYGPRLTGSPNLKAAGEWAIKQMTAWGFESGHLEPWDFGHPGWMNERFSGFINSPVQRLER
jgi:carboxypeptidase Q